MDKGKKEKIDKVFERNTKSPLIKDATLFIENTSGDFSYTKNCGDCNIDTPIVIASITKLYTTTCIFQLIERKLLSLEDKISSFFDDDILKGLLAINSNEYAYNLTIKDLLSHSSGLDDPFETKNRENSKRMQDVLNNKHITFEDFVSEAKSLKPRFTPGKSNKAFYSSMNFDLLGKIIEKIVGLPLPDVFKQYIFDYLGLQKTYIPTNEKFVPKVYYGDKLIYAPNWLMSVPASGGGISTSYELMIFLKAFWGGKLFCKDIFKNLSFYKRIQPEMGPIRYGIGYMQIPLNSIYTFYLGKGNLLVRAVLSAANAA